MTAETKELRWLPDAVAAECLAFLDEVDQCRRARARR
jgi:hypothetical protein